MLRDTAIHILCYNTDAACRHMLMPIDAARLRFDADHIALITPFTPLPFIAAESISFTLRHATPLLPLLLMPPPPALLIRY